MRNLIIIFVVAVLAGAAGLFVLLRGGGKKQADQNVIPPPVDLSASWPVFRGSPRLDGAAPGRLGRSPRLIWQFRAGGDDNKSAPVISGGTVVYAAAKGRVYALNLADGRKIWQRDVGAELASSPCITGDSVLIARNEDDYNGELLRLRLADGAEIWRIRTGKVETSVNVGGSGGRAGERQTQSGPSAAGSRQADGRIIIGTYMGDVLAIESADGGEIWKDRQDDRHVLGCPAADGDILAVSSCDGMALEIFSISAGVRTARTELDAYVPASASLAGASAFIGTLGGELNDADAGGGANGDKSGKGTPRTGGKIFRVDCKAGKAVWSKGFAGAEFYNSPALADGRVVVGATDYYVRCLDQADGRLIWSFKARAGIGKCGPAVCDGKVVFGDDLGWLYMLDLADGKEVWSYELGSAVMASPAVAGGWIVVACRDGRVTAFYARPESGK